jgi:hypothetical protein
MEYKVKEQKKSVRECLNIGLHSERLKEAEEQGRDFEE